MRQQDSLIIHDLTFAIDDKPLLKNINLTVAKKEFVGLIGPNGAGKSTLLRCINGINSARGEIKLMGQSLSELTSKQVAKLVGYMPQEIQIAFDYPAMDVVLTGRYPYLSWRRNLTANDYEIAKRCMEYTRTVNFANTPIKQVSGGERQRILFAKVLAQETDVLLLDEPTSSLDISYQEDIFKYSSQLCQQGKTIIMAVHDLRLAAQFCTRLVLMEQGKIIADGTPQEVLTEDNLAVAYGIQALVFKNKVTGMLDLYSYDRSSERSSLHIHIIGGGGSAVEIMRQSFERGYLLSGGVYHEGDSDLECAKIFAVDAISCASFTEINGVVQQQNINKIREADLTVLCNIPVGRYNLANLVAAGQANKLVIIEDTSFASRDYSDGVAQEIYNTLKEKAIVLTTNQFSEFLDRENRVEE